MCQHFSHPVDCSLSLLPDPAVSSLFARSILESYGYYDPEREPDFVIPNLELKVPMVLSFDLTVKSLQLSMTPWLSIKKFIVRIYK